ncbi:MAG TPA: signal peptidase I [Phycisphaeraceae bacterium]|nr:signal peptidase I [Phycisphaeraceae bacterium]
MTNSSSKENTPHPQGPDLNRQAEEQPQAQAQAEETENIREMLQSILIAFVLAFVFRAFIVEAFVIPTGSMAPTLLGKHLRFQSPETGYNFTVNPHDYYPSTDPKPLQTVDVVDPMAGDRLSAVQEKLHSGDRILVLKYIYSLFKPERFDVIVFKNPHGPAENYIKRLIGLPGEDIWLVDGDVYARPSSEKDALDTPWQIQRKPLHVQREVWQPVYHSQYHPVHEELPGAPPFRPRWKAVEGKWQIEGRSSFICDSADYSAIVFDPPGGITDYTCFDQTAVAYNRRRLFNVADVRVAAGIKPQQAGLQTTIDLNARGHDFQAVVGNGSATLRMRGDGEKEWKVLAQTSVKLLVPGRVTNLEFWHVDQSLSLFINGRRVAYAEYDWQPAERFNFATGSTFQQVREIEKRRLSINGRRYNALLDNSMQPKPAVISWSFTGSPVRMFRVEVDRDLYYRPTSYPSGEGPALATHPDNIARLNRDEFFPLGDNSALSNDGRTWDPPDDWVAYRVDPKRGVVNRRLLMGKAFFVYWPSMQPFRSGGKLLVPDFGRMRFIR